MEASCSLVASAALPDAPPWSAVPSVLLGRVSRWQGPARCCSRPGHDHYKESTRLGRRLKGQLGGRDRYVMSRRLCPSPVHGHTHHLAAPSTPTLLPRRGVDADWHWHWQPLHLDANQPLPVQLQQPNDVSLSQVLARRASAAPRMPSSGVPARLVMCRMLLRASGLSRGTMLRSMHWCRSAGRPLATLLPGNSCCSPARAYPSGCSWEGGKWW